MKFRRLENYINVIKIHLQDLECSVNVAEVEHYLSCYLVVTIYSEYENLINVLISRRCNKINDIPVFNFITSVARCGSTASDFERKRKAGRINIKDLKERLNQFGSAYTESFEDKLKGNESSISAWSSLIQQRNNIAHQAVIGLTLHEIIELYNNSKNILLYFAEALELDQNDIVDLRQ